MRVRVSMTAKECECVKARACVTVGNCGSAFVRIRTWSLVGGWING